MDQLDTELIDDEEPGDILTELCDQFDREEQERIKSAEAKADKILEQGNLAARKRQLAGGLQSPSDWAREPEFDARADAAGVVFTACVNAFWRRTDLARSESIQEFRVNVDKLVELVIDQYGSKVGGLVAKLRGLCALNVQFVLQSRAATAASGEDTQQDTDKKGGSKPDAILDFLGSSRDRKKREAYLNASTARRRGGRIKEDFDNQESLLRDARSWAKPVLKESASGVTDVQGLKELVVNKTWDQFVPKHRFRRYFQLSYEEFERTLWEEGRRSPSLEDYAIEILAERATSVAEVQSTVSVKKPRGRPAKIQEAAKRRALEAKSNGATGKKLAQLVYETQHPTARQVKDAPIVLANYVKSLERTKKS